MNEKDKKSCATFMRNARKNGKMAIKNYLVKTESTVKNENILM